MDGANGFYGQHYQALDPRRSLDSFGASAHMADLGMNPMEDSIMGEGQSLDDIVSQNNTIQRRRGSMQPTYRASGHDGQRRASMMDFTPAVNPDLSDFQFDPNPTSQASVGNGDATMMPQHNPPNIRKARSSENLAINTQYPSTSSGFDTMPSTATFASPLDPGSAMSLNAANQFLTTSMGGLSMDFGVNGGTSGDVTPMNMYSNSSYQNLFADSPVQQNLQSSIPGALAQDPGRTGVSDSQTMMGKVQQMSMPGSMPTFQQDMTNQPGMMLPDVTAPSTAPDVSPLGPLAVQQPARSLDPMKGSTQPAFANGNVAPLEITSKIPPGPAQSQYPNAYSASGFDMLGVLMRVAGRPNPEINIGPVDMSCAFVVCDISQHDLPIVYCSDVFERLTGYTRYEILGRNCRFLQAPDGKVQAGVKRKYVDDKSVLQLKNKISQRSEVQLSLINYRKGGQPFMNLLTMIPVPWDTDEFRYYVGFQVDLVEQPNSIAGKNPDGSYAINYQRGSTLPQYILPTPETNPMGELGQTIGRDEVSTVLSTIGQGESELSKRIWDKVLLENTDDVVHVLSLKGLFLYLSPASRKVLEYDASELVGTALSSVCHPSDIVPVTRELKDTTSGATINVVYRIRRKLSGYTWFEAHGSLHTEQGKGRKCIILVGRERPVYALSKTEILQGGGIGDNELWTKMSTSGMFLYVSSNVRTLLDQTPEDLIGTSMQALMRAESKAEFGRVLEAARTGKRVSFKHDMQNRRGQVLQAQTVVYPGDATEGAKPTFLVAQTRMFKLSRSLLASNRTNATSPKTDQASAGSITPSTNLSGGSTGLVQSRATPGTPLSSQSNMYDTGILTQPGSTGLMIGNQAEALASEDNIFDELKTTRSTSWQFELRQMEKQNRLLVEELQNLLARKKKRKRRKGAGQMEKDCANCHTRVTPEWRRGPSGNRDLCNSCGLRWAKQNGRVSPRKSISDSGDKPTSPSHPTFGGSKAQSERADVAAANEHPHLAKTARIDANPRSSFTGGMPEKLEEESEPEEELTHS